MTEKKYYLAGFVIRTKGSNPSVRFYAFGRGKSVGFAFKDAYKRCPKRLRASDDPYEPRPGWDAVEVSEADYDAYGSWIQTGLKTIWDVWLLPTDVHQKGEVKHYSEEEVWRMVK